MKMYENVKRMNVQNKYLHKMMNDEGRERIQNGHNSRTYFINPFIEFEDFESFGKMRFNLLVIGLKEIKIDFNPKATPIFYETQRS